MMSKKQFWKNVDATVRAAKPSSMIYINEKTKTVFDWGDDQFCIDLFTWLMRQRVSYRSQVFEELEKSLFFPPKKRKA